MSYETVARDFPQFGMTLTNLTRPRDRVFGNSSSANGRRGCGGGDVCNCGSGQASCGCKASGCACESNVSSNRKASPTRGGIDQEANDIGWRSISAPYGSYSDAGGMADTVETIMGAVSGNGDSGGFVKDPGECPCMELYSQAKQACATGMGDPCWRAVHYYMLCKNGHPECPNLDMPPKSKVRKCGADVTKHLVKLMKEAYKNLHTNMLWIGLYYQVLRPGGMWDWKQEHRKPHEWSCEVECPDTLALCGICFDDSVPANMLLGYVLAEFGMSRKEIRRLITMLVSPKEWPEHDRAAFDVGMFLSSRLLNNLGDWTGPKGTDAVDTICKMVQAFQSSLQAPINKECASAPPCAFF